MKIKMRGHKWKEQITMGILNTQTGWKYLPNCNIWERLKHRKDAFSLSIV